DGLNRLGRLCFAVGFLYAHIFLAGEHRSALGKILMRFILSLIGTICIGPALSSGLAHTNAGLLPAPLAMLTPTNQTKLMAILTVTNTFPGSIEGRAYVVPSTNRFVLASVTAA